MEQRQHRDHRLLTGHAKRRVHLHRVRDQVVVAEHHALRKASRPTRVRKRRNIVSCIAPRRALLRAGPRTAAPLRRSAQSSSVSRSAARRCRAGADTARTPALAALAPTPPRRSSPPPRTGPTSRGNARAGPRDCSNDAQPVSPVCRRQGTPPLGAARPDRRPGGGASRRPVGDAERGWWSVRPPATP
jgi:hypothetical protein